MPLKNSLLLFVNVSFLLGLGLCGPVSKRAMDSLGNGNLLRSMDTLGNGNLLRSMDTLGNGNLLRSMDTLGNGNLLRSMDTLRNANLLRSIDSLGNGNLLRSMDTLGNGNLLRSMDTLGHGNLLGYKVLSGGRWRAAMFVIDLEDIAKINLTRVSNVSLKHVNDQTTRNNEVVFMPKQRTIKFLSPRRTDRKTTISKDFKKD